MERRAALGGHLPQRRMKTSFKLEVPPLTFFWLQIKGSEGREISRPWPSCIFSQNSCAIRASANTSCRSCLMRAARSVWKACSAPSDLYSQVGQLYRPEDADQLMYYKEDKTGQILEEGINEAGAISSWIAAATSYSTSNVPMIPFFIYYSMFGFQRIGDLAWVAGDMRSTRVLDRRYVRPHDFQWRGSPTPGRSQPSLVRDDPKLRLLTIQRSATSWRSSSRRASSACSSTKKMSSTISLRSTRTTCTRPCPRVRKTALSTACISSRALIRR